MQIIHITGNLGNEPKFATTQRGDDICNLSVGVRQGWSDSEKTNWYRVAIWGKRAKTVADNLRKGQKVTVAGEFSIGEYDGKPQYEVRAYDIDWVPAGQRRDDDGLTHRNQDGFGGSRRPSSGPNFDQDIDDEVPF